MITAVLMNEQSISSHFTKAQSVAFFNGNGEELKRFPNPALNTSCGGKAALAELLKEQGAERVLVRNIGQKMLGRLLSMAIKVLQLSGGQRRHHALQSVIASCADISIELTDQNQGAPSINHQKKKAAGETCCGQHQEAHSESRCCGSEHAGKGHGQHKRGGRCCH